MNRSKPNLSRLLMVLALLVPLASGCARLQTVSEVKPDGSLVRALIVKQPLSGTEGGKPNPMAGLAAMGGSKPEELLILPEGPDWKVSRENGESEVTITYTRIVAAGGTLTDDLGVRKNPPEPEGFDLAAPEEPAPAPEPKPAPKKPTPKKAPPKAKPGTRGKTGKPGKPEKASQEWLARSLMPERNFCQPPGTTVENPAPQPLLTNSVSVREIEGNRLEYREVIRWRGAPPQDLHTADKDMAAELKKLLPAEAASDTRATEATVLAAHHALWRLFFGPGDPLLSLLLINPDLAEYRLKSRLSAALEDALAAHFGSRLTAQQRKAIVARLADDLGKEGLKKSEAMGGPGGPPAEEKNSMNEMGAPVALFMRVRMPGKVVSTNGELDPYTGEVLWNFYSWAPAAGELVLTAICEK